MLAFNLCTRVNIHILWIYSGTPTATRSTYMQQPASNVKLHLETWGCLVHVTSGLLISAHEALLHNTEPPALTPCWYVGLQKQEAGSLSPDSTHWKVVLSQESLASLQSVAPSS